MFVAFFQGEQLKSRIRKVCTGFHASLYPCPHSHAERQEMVKGVRTRLEDLNLVRKNFLVYTEDQFLLSCYFLLFIGICWHIRCLLKKMIVKTDYEQKSFQYNRFIYFLIIETDRDHRTSHWNDLLSFSLYRFWIKRTIIVNAFYTT